MTIGMMGVVGNTICLTYIDKVNRRVPLMISASAQCVLMTLFTIFFKEFANGTNKVGQGFTIAWLFLFSIAFSLGYDDHVVALSSAFSG